MRFRFLLVLLIACVAVTGCGKRGYTAAEKTAYLAQFSDIVAAHGTMLQGEDSNALVDPAKRKAAEVLMSAPGKFREAYEGTDLDAKFGLLALVNGLSTKSEAYALLAVVSGQEQTAELVGDQLTEKQKADIAKTQTTLAEYKALIDEAGKKRDAAAVAP